MSRVHGVRPPSADVRCAFFLDIDGTLAEFTDDPATAAVQPALRRCVETLYRTSGGALALISGRAIADIDALFPGVSLPVAGQHGIERRDAAGRVAIHPFAAGRMDLIRGRVAAALGGRAGVVIEDKGGSLAVHYRHAPRLAPFVHRTAQALADDFRPDIVVQTGKRVVELLPAGMDKGKAVLAFLEEAPFHGRVPVFVGDDVTDEYAFTVVNRRAGCSVKVGRGRTTARWRLHDVTDVQAWLEAAA